MSGTFPMVDEHWWRTAVIYQVYVRSFADDNGDGEGDIAGIRRHLGHLSELGVDALWITPWYPSPLKDGGYDIADYVDIDPRFGVSYAAPAPVRQHVSVNTRPGSLAWSGFRRATSSFEKGVGLCCATIE